MILNELRGEWERGHEIIGVFPMQGRTCVILRKLHKGQLLYFLHRYFAIGEDWHYSFDVDVNGGTLEQCVVKLSEIMQEA